MEANKEPKKIHHTPYNKIAMEAITPGIRRLFNRGLLCDCDVIIDGKTFSAHRIILASVSDYFRDVFAPEAHNRGEKVTVHVDGFSATAFEKWLHYVYAHELDVNEETVIEVLASAIKTKFELLRQQCIYYMLERADNPTCTLPYLYAAQKYAMDDVAAIFMRSLTRNSLEAVSKHISFKEVDKEMMCDILFKSSQQRTVSQYDLYKSAKAWMYRSKIKPKKKIETIEPVRPQNTDEDDSDAEENKVDKEKATNNNMPPEENINIQEKEVTDTIRKIDEKSTESEQCNGSSVDPPEYTESNKDEVVTEGENSNKKPRMSDGSIESNNEENGDERSETDSCNLHRDLSLSSDDYDDESDEEDFEIDPMELLKYIDFQWIPRDDLLAIYESNFMHRIPELKLHIHDILFPGVVTPTHLSGISLGKNNIALMYNFVNNERGRGTVEGPSYTTFEHMELLNYEGKIYMCGSNRYPFLAPDVFKALDVRTRTWTKLSRMSESGREKSIFGLAGNIFLVGGCQVIESMEPMESDIIILATVERYSITHDKWFRMRDFPIKTQSMPVCILNGTPYASGGITDGGKEVNILYRYNIEDDMWKIIGGLKQRTSGHEMLGFNDTLYFVLRDRSIETYNVITKQFSVVQANAEPSMGWYVTSRHCCATGEKVYYLDEYGVLHVLDLRDNSVVNLNQKWLTTFCDYLVLF